MKKERIDGYDLYSENGELKKIIFKDFNGKEISISIGQSLKVEFLERRKEKYSEQYEKRKHLDKYLQNDYILELKASNNMPSTEDVVIQKDRVEKIIQEIWKLPTPQNRRVYMKVVDGFSLTEIARIEKRSISAVKESIDNGINRLKNNLKNF